MKRDMDLIRAILLAVEDSNEHVLDAGELVSESWDQVTVARHMELLLDAGLAEGDVSEYLGGGVDAMIFRLTWTGHDFLDAIRSDAVWQTTKATVAEKVGSASFEVIKAVAAAVAMKALGL